MCEEDSFISVADAARRSEPPNGRFTDDHPQENNSPAIAEWSVRN